jgi:hypothetical protein
VTPSLTCRAAARRRRHPRKSPPRSCKFRSHVAIGELPTTDARKVAVPPLAPPLVPPLAPPPPLPNSPRRTWWPPTRKPHMLVLPSPLWSSRPASLPRLCLRQPGRAATAQWYEARARRRCERLHPFAIQCRLLTCEKPTIGGAGRRTSCCCCCCTEYN